MPFNRYPATLIFIFLLSSCGTSYYVPAMYGHDNEYKIKPHTLDSTRSMIYGAATFLVFHGVRISGQQTAVQLSGYRSHTFDYFNISYGINFSSGGFKADDLDALTQNQRYSFTTYGATAAFHYKFALGKVDLRPAGIALGYQREAGSYARFRNAYNSSNEDAFRFIRQNQYFSIGYDAELDVMATEYLKLGFRVGYYTPIRTAEQRGYPNYFAGNIVTNSFISYRNYALTTGLDVGGMNAAFRLGLSYGFASSPKK
ncbi:MAG: hypothetical protein INR69_14820 [Mucilaginibacter polytrichastri]|nr:hypothetical protein [Mucilaginibacter polytrichastri]